MGGCPVNGNTVLTDQVMRIATLEAEKYTDAQIAKLYEYNRGNEKELWELKAEVKCLKEIGECNMAKRQESCADLVYGAGFRQMQQIMINCKNAKDFKVVLLKQSNWFFTR